MSEIKIKIMLNEQSFENDILEPLVEKILDGKRNKGPNDSVLGGVCQDLLYFLHSRTNCFFRYEKNSRGHFFVIDEEILTNENTKNIFATNSIRYERVSFLD